MKLIVMNGEFKTGFYNYHKIHDNWEDAVKEAREVCERNHEEVSILQLIGTFTPQTAPAKYNDEKQIEKNNPIKSEGMESL